MATQLTFLFGSLTVIYFDGNFAGFGFLFNPWYTLVSIPLSLILAIPLFHIALRMAEGAETVLDGYEFTDFEYALLFLIIAPIGEEVLFRGLLESPLLAYGIAIGIAVPAVLFAVIHIIPFKNSAPIFLGWILLSALILGILTSVLRALSDSIVPAIFAHSLFNLSGRIAERFKL